MRQADMRQADMRQDDYEYLRRFLKTATGLSLSMDKQYLAESRLRPLVRALGLEDIASIVQHLRAAPNGPSRQRIIDAMMTNETLFFRDQKPFDVLADSILPALHAARPPGQPLRIWSAAASTGQEAYSIAMLIDEMSGKLGGRKTAILGTDISLDAVERAKAAQYSQFEVQRGLSIHRLMRYFEQSGNVWKLNDRLRAMVSFQHRNLFDASRPAVPHDIIFCRNLLIYFDIEEKRAAFRALASALAPDGYLILGGAESTHGLTDDFAPDPDNRSIHRPVRAAHHGAPERSRRLTCTT